MRAVARLRADGSWHPFPASLPSGSATLGFAIPNCISAIAVQADGRILASGCLYSGVSEAPLGRALAAGGADASFSLNFISTPYPIGNGLVLNNGRVEDLLLQPDGKLLVAGAFAEAGGVPHYGLARLLAAAPLATAAAAETAAFKVWPVPARGELHVEWPATRPARQVELLDVLGRTLQTQVADAPTLTLPTAALPAGLYLLRVRYADGRAATRRVVLE